MVHMEGPNMRESVIETGRAVLASPVAEALRSDLAKTRPFATGTIIAWESVASTGIRYAYAAIFANGTWYTTLQQDNSNLKRRMTHQEMLGYLSTHGDNLANLRVATDFEAVQL